MISCEQIIGRNNFESYSEFYLALCIAAECGRRGLKLGMSSMKIEKDIAPKAKLAYFKNLVGRGLIYIEDLEADVSNIEESELEFDTNLFVELGSILTKNLEDRYYWSYEYAVERYDREYYMSVLNKSKLDNMLMHLAAYFIVGFYLGDLEKKKVEIEIKNMLVSSVYTYVNLVSCCKTLEWFNDIFIMNIDFNDSSVDIDYYILYNNSLASGRNKLWGIKDKHSFMEKEGLVEGAIAVLWSRKGIKKSNPLGRILNAIIIRIDEIHDDHLVVTTIAVNKTKEEVVNDFYDIPEDHRYLFVDMLDSKPSMCKRTLSLYDTGIQTYFFRETEFITKLDKISKVSKRVTVYGEVGDVEMSEVDAIYWLLNQYEVEFDSDLYKRMYSPDKDLLWDRCGMEE